MSLFVHGPIIGWCQLSYEELPDTIFQVYEYEKIVEQILPDEYHSDIIRVKEATFKTVPKYIDIKTYYKNCDHCEYEAYVDSIETKPAYQKIIPYRKIRFNGFRIEQKSTEEWAWVKRFNAIPNNHQPCLNRQQIDTCLWDYVVINPEVRDSIELKNYYSVADTIVVPAQFIPIKKYRLKKEHADANKQRYPIGSETCTVLIHQLEEKEEFRSVTMLGTYRTRQVRRLHHFEEVTPLSFEH